MTDPTTLPGPELAALAAELQGGTLTEFGGVWIWQIDGKVFEIPKEGYEEACDSHRIYRPDFNVGQAMELLSEDCALWSRSLRFIYGEWHAFTTLQIGYGKCVFADVMADTPGKADARAITVAWCLAKLARKEN
jgi:hypothetical protein